MSKRTGSGVSSLLLAVATVGVVVLVAGIFPFRQILAGNREVGDAGDKLAAIEAETEILEARIAALKTPEEVERLAREQFGLVMPSEIGYVVVTPPWEEDHATREPGPVEGDPVGKPWWQGIWDWLTGRDLVEDG